MTRIATFNVNGVNGRLPVLLKWLGETSCDIVCLQELKCTDAEQALATIPVPSKQPFGLAFDEARQWLYAACWTSGEIAGINLTSLRAEKSLHADR